MSKNIDECCSEYTGQHNGKGGKIHLINEELDPLCGVNMLNMDFTTAQRVEIVSGRFYEINTFNSKQEVLPAYRFEYCSKCVNKALSI